MTQPRQAGTMGSMIVGNPIGEVGAFKPLKLVKKVAKVAFAPALLAVQAAKFATDIALKPVRSRIETLKARRARKIAWDRRRSKQPTPAERAEARAWVKAEFKRKGPHGHILAALAGAEPETAPLGSTLGALPAAVVAAIPALLVLANTIINAAAKSGAAPAADPASAAPAVAAEEMEGALGAGLSPNVTAGLVIGSGALLAVGGFLLARSST